MSVYVCSVAVAECVACDWSCVMYSNSNHSTPFEVYRARMRVCVCVCVCVLVSSLVQVPSLVKSSP